MTEQQLQRSFLEVANVNDLLIIVKKEFHEHKWADYYPDHKTAIIYSLDEDGEEYDKEVLIREGLHEVAHHLQFHYLPYEVEEGNEHDYIFRMTYLGLLRKYYNGEIPQTTLNHLKESGYLA